MSAKQVFPYVVSLQANHVGTVQWIGGLASACSAGTFLLAYFIDITQRNLFWLIGALCIVAVILWNLYQKRIQNQTKPYRYALLLAAITWLSMPYARWISILLLVMFLLESTAIRPIEIGFGSAYIWVNGLIPKKILWQDVSQVILKDNLLTIDFHSNRIWQKEVIDEEDPDAGEDEFNLFCQDQITLHATTRSG
jgi:hypothetical protein